MTWTATNAGMVRGRWRTRHRCDQCGHTITDTDPAWKQQRREHERSHAGHDTLYDDRGTAT